MLWSVQVAAGVTGRTGVRTALITLGRADQGIPGAVTGGTPIMHLRVAAVGEGGRRIDVTDQAAGITGDIPGADVVNIAMNHHKLVVVTLKAVDRAEVVHVGDGIQHVLPRTVVTGGTGTGAVGGNIMFDTFDLRPGRDNVTVTAKDARWVVGQIAGSLVATSCTWLEWELGQSVPWQVVQLPPTLNCLPMALLIRPPSAS